MPKVLLGVTGSVAAIKVPTLCEQLTKAGHAVQVVTTRAGLYFFNPSELNVPVHRDEDEWPGWESGRRYLRDDPVLHIELRRWAELLLIAPLDANTLAKLANGLADNCLTCVWRAWDPARPVVLAPAMNTFMWEHPLSARHLRQLALDAGAGDAPVGLDSESLVEWINQNCLKLHFVPPVTKRLACGDVGVGALAEVEAIVAAVTFAVTHR
jgi:phosphopantothenoylcysteine decarboxylase